MSDSSLLLPKIIAVGAMGFAAGFGWACSYIAIPPILGAQNPLEKAHQWRTMFTKGKATGPPLAAATTSLLAYIAYHARSQAEARFYAATAVAPLLIVPFTLVFLEPTNQLLLAKAQAWDRKEVAEAGKGEEGSVDALVVKWRNLNYLRSVVPFAATGMAVAGCVLF